MLKWLFRLYMSRKINPSIQTIADFNGDVNELFKIDVNSDVPMLCTRNLFFFPGVVSPIVIGRPASLKLLEFQQKNPEGVFAVFCQKDVNVDLPQENDLYKTGVYAKLLRVMEMPGNGGSVTAIIQALGRCELEQITHYTPFYQGMVKHLEEAYPLEGNKEFRTAMQDLRQKAVEYIHLNDDVPNETEFVIRDTMNDIICLSFIQTNLPFSVVDKANLIEGTDTMERLFRTLRLMNRDLELLRLKQSIQSKTRQDLDEQQREYFLKQQIKNIEEELGGGDGSSGTGIQRAIKLSTDLGRSPLGGVYERRPGLEARTAYSRPRPLWHGESQRAHPGIYLRVKAARRPQIPHPLFVWPPGCGQDKSRQEHRCSHEAQVCPGIVRRIAR